MRSLATRDFGNEISAALPDVVAACKAAGFDLDVSADHSPNHS